MQTLYMLQGNYQQSFNHLQQLKSLLLPQDMVILLGEAVFAYLDFQLSADFVHLSAQFWVLDEEYQHLNHQAQEQLQTPLTVSVMSFDDWVDFILNHQRCVRLV